MPDINSMVIANATKKYENKNDISGDSSGNFGTSKIQYSHLPNLFNRKNNDLMEISGNMILTADLHIYEGGLRSDKIEYKKVSNDDLSGNLQIGKRTKFINIGNTDTNEAIFKNVGNSAIGVRTLSNEYDVINIGTNAPTATNNVRPNFVNLGNHEIYSAEANHLPNLIYLGGGDDRVQFSGGAVEFRCKSSVTVNTTRAILNFENGQDPNTSVGTGLKIKVDGDVNAGVIESSSDYGGYLIRGPSGRKDNRQSTFKLDISNLVLPTSTSINPTLGIHDVSRGLVVLQRPLDTTEASFNMIVESFDMSNIFIRDSSVNFSDNEFQKINTKFEIEKDSSFNQNLFVASDVCMNQTLFSSDTNVNIHGKMNITDDVSLNSSFFVGGKATIDGDVSINQRIFADGNANFNKRLFVGSNAIFGGDVSMNQRLFVLDDTSFNSSLFVKEKAIFDKDVSMNSHLQIDKSLIIGGNINIEQYEERNVIQTTTNNQLIFTIEEDVSLNGRLFIRDDASFNNRLFIGKEAILHDDVSMNSRLFVGGKAVLEKKMFVGSNSIFEGITKTILESSNFVQLGSNIFGEGVADEFGGAVSVNGDGSIIAAGAVKNDGNGNTDAGHVRVFKYSTPGVTGGTLQQLGADIDGLVAGDYFGQYLSLNESGTILAVSAPFNDSGASNAGQIRVFIYSTPGALGGTWQSLGAGIDFTSVNQFFLPVSLNNNGSVLGVGLPYDSTSRPR